MTSVTKPTAMVVAAATLALALLLGAALLAGSDEASAKHTDGHQPANKVAVSGSSMDEAGPQEDITLMETTMRNANSKALVLQVTLECSILTDLETVGDHFARAESTLEVWVEIDGVPVEVSEEGGDDTVTFCNREYQRETSNFEEDEEATIDDHIRTKQAHGFNWIHLDAGKGVHDIVVKGTLKTDTENDPMGVGTGDATATVTVGKRTLVVEPVDTAHDETLNN